MIYVLAMKSGGQVSATFDGQDEATVLSNMADVGYTEVQIVDVATYQAFVAAHARSI